MVAIRSLIRFIGILSLTILIITLFSFIIVKKEEETNVIYTMVIVINGFVVIGSYMADKWLADDT